MNTIKEKGVIALFIFFFRHLFVKAIYKKLDRIACDLVN